MEEEGEFMKLPTDEKCVHKVWKARVAGYEEALKLFSQIDDEKSPEWSKYVGLIRKFVVDSNVVAQEKGLEAALVFVENCGHAGKTTGDVMAGIVTKCMAAPKAKTRDLALQITLMYIEIEKQEAVMEELIKGMEAKNPKIVSACIIVIRTALSQYGNKVISIKPLVKKISPMLSDRDKDVRAEGKALVVEIHRWIGGAIEQHISSLQAVMQQELKDAFAANAGDSPYPSRYLRSQQNQQRPIGNRDTGSGDAEYVDEVDEGNGDTADMDPFDLLDPVDILSKLPKDFYDKLEAKKWQERKESLDALEGLLKNAPRLEPGDYADLVRALKRVIAKDTNVVLVAAAGRSMASIASGLRNKFQPYAVSCTSTVLEKFKEKKPNVVSAMRDAIDAIYPSTTLEAIMEDTLEAFNNKNPAVKTESSLFLARALTKTQPTALNKKLLKAYVGGLLKLLESADPAVRDAAAEALGTAMKLVGEKNIGPHIGKLDNLKEQKIKEFCDKAVIQVKVPTAASRPRTAPSNDQPTKGGSTQPKAVKRPTTATAKKVPAAKKAVAGSRGSRVAGISSCPPAREPELSQEEVDIRAEELLGASVINGLADSNWKIRLEAIQNFTSSVQSLSSSDAGSQVLFRTVNKKPGLKETNFQVLKLKLEVVKLIAESFPITSTGVDFVLHDIVEKLGDVKCSQAAGEALTALAEATKLDHVALEALDFAMDKQKSPKVQAETLVWLGNAIREFGLEVNSKSLITHLKKAIANNNPVVRTATISFLGNLYLYMGPSLMVHFDGEKPALKQQISSEFDKWMNEKPPTPVRGLSKSASKASMSEDLAQMSDQPEDDYADEEMAPPIPQDNQTRTDISPQITEALIEKINDKNWKMRNEALEKVKSIITTSAPIKSSLGELPQALAMRLVDSNAKIVQLALQICESLVQAMGSKCKTHVRTLFPGFFQGFGDNKQWLRAAASQCASTWCQSAGMSAVLDGELIFDAMKTGSPTLRTELFNWLSERLPDVPPKSFNKEELVVCLPVLYACLEDRNADVRKACGEVVYGFMLHLGYDSMQKQTEKLKPGSKTVVLASLDKARQNLPIQPLPTKAKVDPKAVKSGGALKAPAQKAAAGQVAVKGKAIVKPNSASSTRSKKDDDEANTPLLPRNNLKNQRIIDDQKLKVLKWNFTLPREEFYDLLKDQMTNAGVAKHLIANMFHADFRYHIKSIESLTEDLADNGPALISNLDLILKWMTLRFFDTNPSVLLKGLDYLSCVFQYLNDEGYTMAEYEANCFIPYLILKIGDPKDAVRNGVKNLFKQICIVYSVNKLFGYLMEGLKSKNARQRSECLECIGSLVETYGMSVISGSGSYTGPLKEIAKLIGDRDNAVRSAALNAVASTYFLEGEKIYKMVGQMNDKDMSLLEERIKRAAKTRTTTDVRKTMAPMPSVKVPIVQHIEVEKSPPNQITVDTIPGANQDDDEEEYVTQIDVVPIRTPQPRQPPEKYPPPPVYASGIGLDTRLLTQLDAQKLEIPNLVLKEIDSGYLEEPVPVLPRPPPSLSSRASVHPLVQAPPRTSAMPSMGNTTQILSPMAPSLPFHPRVHGTPPEDNILSEIITNLGSPRWTVAENAIAHLDGICRSGNAALLLTYEEQIIQGVVVQFDNLKDLRESKEDVYNAYKCLLLVPNLIYDNRSGGRTVTTQTLQSLISALLMLLGSNNAPPGGPAGESFGQLVTDDKMIKMVNHLCARIIDHSERTNLLCALLALLHSSVSAASNSARFRDLVLKCIWKSMKMLQTWPADSIDYDRLLPQMHLFMKAYPSSYWKQNPTIGDTALRTVKTLLHTCMKRKGHSMMNHLHTIPNWQDSELHHYMTKLCKYLKIDETMKIEEANDDQLSRALGAEVNRILTKIVDKENSRDALNQLYDLKESHQSLDIWEHVKGTSMILKSYVEQNLSQIAEQRKYGIRPMYNTDTALHIDSDSNMNDGGVEKDADYYMNRLKLLKGGFNVINSTPYSQPSIIDNRTHYDHITLPSLMAPSQFNVPGSGNDNNLNEIEGGSDEKDPVYYMKRLRILQTKAGMNVSSLDQKIMMDSAGDNTNRLGLDPKFDVSEVQSFSQKKDSLDALKQQLQQIKNSKK